MSFPALSNFDLLETRLIWIQDRPVEKSRKSNSIPVEDIPAWLVRRGALVVHAGGERIRANAGKWVIPRQGPGWVHTLPNSKILSLRFRLRWPNGQEIYRRRETQIFPAARWPQLSQAANRLLQRVRPQPLWQADAWQPHSCHEYLLLKADFYRWLTAYGQCMQGRDQGHDDTTTPASPIALETRRILQNWDLGTPFSRQLLADRLGLGVQAVGRHFAATYGMTPHEFLEQRRLDWARQRLAQSGERVKLIAGEIGFTNLAQFSTWFRLRKQVSPRAYRAAGDGDSL